MTFIQNNGGMYNTYMVIGYAKGTTRSKLFRLDNMSSVSFNVIQPYSGDGYNDYAFLVTKSLSTNYNSHRVMISYIGCQPPSSDIRDNVWKTIAYS